MKGARASVSAALLLAVTFGTTAAADEPGRVATVHVGEIDAVPSGPGVGERLVEIRRRIQRALAYPPIARRQGLEGAVRVRFEIDRSDGKAFDIALARSSGHYLLDEAAKATVRRAGGLPWIYGRLEVPIRFALEAAR